MFKPENIEDTLVRIASQEVGLKINPNERIYLGQYVGKFKTEMERQDISTGFLVKSETPEVILNEDHFHSFKLISSVDEIPSNIGAMYSFYLKNYFAA